MNFNEKKRLRAIYRAPEPERKNEFLTTLPQRPRPTDLAILRMQLPYIRKRIWLVSVLLFVLASVFATQLGEQSLYLVAALMPFASVLAVLENARSVRFRMEELELSTRFSLPYILLVRMSAVGVGNLLLLFACTLLLRHTGALPVLIVAPYLLVPYLFTAVLGMLVLRRSRQGGSELCLGIAAGISLLTALGPELALPVFTPDYFALWAIFAAVLLFLTAALLFRQYQKAEELL